MVRDVTDHLVNFSGKVDEEYGKYLFSREAVDQLDSRTTAEKIGDVVVAIFNDIAYVFTLAPGLILSLFSAIYDECGGDKEWKEESKGLYVLVHGLNGHPVCWESYRRELLEEQGECDLFIPYVPKKGDCSLEEASDPLLKKIESYTKKHPDKPVCLIGTSNGGRMVDYLADKLSGTRVMVNSIAGVHFGSEKMNMVNEYPIVAALSGLSEEIRDELAFGSERAKKLGESLNTGVEKDTRTHRFYASTEDEMAVRIETTMPRTDESRKPSYYLLHGYRHIGIIRGAQEHLLKEAGEWMRS